MGILILATRHELDALFFWYAPALAETVLPLCARAVPEVVAANFLGWGILMPEYDLNEIQARVEASKQDFLKALEAYKSYDGQQIVERFLVKFKDRSATTREIEQEAEQLIAGFDRERASLATDIELGLIKMQSTVGALASHVIAVGVKKIGESPQPLPGASPMDVLRAQMGKLKEAEKALSDSGQWATETAFQVGVHMERVQTMAADILRLRTLTLRAFKEENIGASFRELTRQMRDRQYARTGILVLDAAWDRTLEAAKKTVDFIADEFPIVRVMKFVRNIVGVIKGKAPDTSAGGTELMNELLSQLKRESSILQDLKKTFGDAMNELDRVDALL